MPVNETNIHRAIFAYRFKSKALSGDLKSDVLNNINTDLMHFAPALPIGVVLHFWHCLFKTDFKKVFYSSIKFES